MLEADALKAFVTTYSFRQDGIESLLLRALPLKTSKKIAGQLRRRAITEIPERNVHNYPTWEILRSVAQKAGVNSAFLDTLHDRSMHSFDALVARRYVPEVDAVQCFEYTCQATFRRAEQEGVAKILHVPSLDSAQFREIELRQRGEWKELATKHDSYFDRRFARRYDRRQREVALADVIVANSPLTARSLIAAGADPAKTFVATLGAPPAIAEVECVPRDVCKPLNAVYAGPVSMRKGAHYLLQAWRSLKAGSAAVLNVYGRVELPQAIMAAGADDVVFHGSVPQRVLYSAYEAADVLVFPTLSDGFGLVVTEALAHGLPVITTDQAGAAVFLTPENGLIVPAADSDALTNALRWCLDNRVTLQGMRFKALEAARRRQWSDFRRDLIQVLDTGLRLKGYSLHSGHTN